MTKPLVLCILDGCGVRKELDGNAFENANKPTIDGLLARYPHSLLQASGPSVGLPEGQMGTSEVGHMNLGSGRVALQPLQAITGSIEDKSLFNNKELDKVIEEIKQDSRRFAKRQYTFFKHQFDVKWFDVDFKNFNNTIDEVYDYIKIEVI